MACRVKRQTKQSAAAKKTAVAKTPDAEQKCAAKKCATKKCASKKITRIIAKINVGWGNSLFIRGAGAELNWDKGVAMQCISEDEWLWEQYVPKGDITFKLLVNDSQWSVGDDFVVSAGESIICRPEF